MLFKRTKQKLKLVLIFEYSKNYSQCTFCQNELDIYVLKLFVVEINVINIFLAKVQFLRNVTALNYVHKTYCFIMDLEYLNNSNYSQYAFNKNELVIYYIITICSRDMYY